VLIWGSAIALSVAPPYKRKETGMSEVKHKGPLDREDDFNGGPVNPRYCPVCPELCAEAARLRAEGERLWEALRFYASASPAWNIIDHGDRVEHMMMKDHGAVADDALHMVGGGDE
jgi:hypothetical protein